MSDKVIRSDKKTFLGIKANGPVFMFSLLAVALLVSATLIVGKPIEIWFKDAQNTLANNLGWFFILLVNCLLGFALFLGFGKYKDVRIGGKDAKPDFSLGGWFAMLFSAGMGIGLLFWGVSEPINHFNHNPVMEAGASTTQMAESAMGISFLHWGVHAWGLYAVVGLALAYFTFNKKLPLTIRSVFHPIWGDKIHGWRGDMIDIISVIATLFGLATSLGFGVQQMNAGLDYLFGIPVNSTVQIILIVGITILATMSLILGLDKGIRKLSEWNMKLALVLMLFLLVVGPTLFLCKSFVQNIGYYINEFFNLSFWSSSYKGINSTEHWQNSWTIFYWAWWISWSPFVGIFIARISRGRTIKEFILGVMLVPTVLTFIWFTVLGGSALYQELIGNHAITEAVDRNIATAIYYLLEQYPLAGFASGLTVLLVASFFVTSSDSGSFVVDTLTSGGRHDAPKGQKIFWASMEGLVAIVLLVGGGLSALQAVTIISGLPFAIVVIVMCYSFYKSLRDTRKQQKEKKKSVTKRVKRKEIVEELTKVSTN